MKTFNLIKDSKFTTWWRDYYEVEAETIEEAINLIIEDKVDAWDMKEIDDSLESMTIEENQGNPTEEIFIDEKPYLNSLWNNVTKFKKDE